MPLLKSRTAPLLPVAFTPPASITQSKVQRRHVMYVAIAIVLVLVLVHICGFGLQLSFYEEGKPRLRAVFSMLRTLPPPSEEEGQGHYSLQLGTPTGAAQLPLGRKGISVVITWVNGSDPNHQRMRAQYQQQKPSGFQKESRFRELDELKYAVRSVRKFTPWANQIVILVQDYRGVDPRPDGARGQVPSWLTQENAKGGVPIRLVRHDEFFDDPDGSLPTFNSRAIESQLANLADMEDDVFVYANDDDAFGRPLEPSQFFSPESGFAFALQQDLLVPPNPLGEPDYRGAKGQGEWPALHWSNHLLSQLFGSRSRPYVAHSTEVLATPLLREMAATFSAAFADTAKHRFRGDGQDVHTTFMAVHYVIEMHRAVVLQHFVNHVLDADEDGTLSKAEVATLEQVMGEANRVNGKGMPVTENDRRWDSRNGYQSVRSCPSSMASCLPADGGISTSAALRRVVQEKLECGDCIHRTLVRASGAGGIEAFLASRSHTPAAEAALARIARYRYSLVNLSQLAFISFKNDDCVAWLEAKKIVANRPAGICLNDDIFNPAAVSGVRMLVARMYADLGLGDDESIGGLDAHPKKCSMTRSRTRG